MQDTGPQASNVKAPLGAPSLDLYQTEKTSQARGQKFAKTVYFISFLCSFLLMLLICDAHKVRIPQRDLEELSSQLKQQLALLNAAERSLQQHDQTVIAEALLVPICSSDEIEQTNLIPHVSAAIEGSEWAKSIAGMEEMLTSICDTNQFVHSSTITLGITGNLYNLSRASIKSGTTYHIFYHRGNSTSVYLADQPFALVSFVETPQLHTIILPLLSRAWFPKLTLRRATVLQIRSFLAIDAHASINTTNYIREKLSSALKQLLDPLQLLYRLEFLETVEHDDSLTKFFQSASSRYNNSKMKLIHRNAQNHLSINLVDLVESWNWQTLKRDCESLFTFYLGAWIPKSNSSDFHCEVDSLGRIRPCKSFRVAEWGVLAISNNEKDQAASVLESFAAHLREMLGFPAADMNQILSDLGALLHGEVIGGSFETIHKYLSSIVKFQRRLTPTLTNDSLQDTFAQVIFQYPHKGLFTQYEIEAIRRESIKTLMGAISDELQTIAQISKQQSHIVFDQQAVLLAKSSLALAKSASTALRSNGFNVNDSTLESLRAAYLAALKASYHESTQVRRKLTTQYQRALLLPIFFPTAAMFVKIVLREYGLKAIVQSAVNFGRQKLLVPFTSWIGHC